MLPLPAVSIGLPVYNGARFLGDAIEDFLRQTYTDFELIVSDNASTDDTEAIVREAADRDERIRYIRNETNIGALPNSNRVFELARGRFYCLAAHDDRRTPDFLERLVDALDSDPSAALAYSRSVLIDETDAPLDGPDKFGRHFMADGVVLDYDQGLERPMPPEAVARYAAVLRSNDINAPIHGVFRREVLSNIGGHHLHGSDRLIVAHAALLGRFAFVDAPLFSFRIHPQSTLFLSREEWAVRETGGQESGAPADTIRTFANYIRAVKRSALGRRDRARAYAATVGYAVRPTALRNVFLPGLDNYFGWRRWPWQRETNSRLSVPLSSVGLPTGSRA